MIFESMKFMNRTSRSILFAFVFFACLGGNVYAKDESVKNTGINAQNEQRLRWLLHYVPGVSEEASSVRSTDRDSVAQKNPARGGKQVHNPDLDLDGFIALIGLVIGVITSVVISIWTFFQWIYPLWNTKSKCKKEIKKYAKRYQTALSGEINKSSIPRSSLESLSVKLSDTFVSLRLSETWRSEFKYNPNCGRSAEEHNYRIRTPEEVMSLVFKKHRLLLVIGDPGSGKTTLLRHYALLCSKKGGFKLLGFTQPVMVFYFSMRELKKTGADFDPFSDNLFAWSEKHDLGIPKDVFFNWLHDNKTLVLLDGLDEISEVDDRIRACKWIDSTFAGRKNACVVVTARTTGYRKGDGIEIETEHVRADIMKFSREQQAIFLKKWFNAAFSNGQFLDDCTTIQQSKKKKSTQQKPETSEALKKFETIIDFLSKKENKSLAELAGIPLLLQIMATLWKERETLPASRLELYNEALNYMLYYLDRRSGIDTLLVADEARRVLSPVSLWMQEKLKKDEVDRAELQQQMQEQLNALSNSLLASDFCQNLVDRAGVLVEYGDREYIFRHKSFREYLAGVQLVENIDKSGSLDDIVTHFGDDWWTEVLRFFIGHIKDEELFDSLMQKLFDSSVTDELTPKHQDLLVTLVREAPLRKIDALKRMLLDPATTPNRQRYIMECLKTIGIKDQVAIDVVGQFAESGITEDVGILRQANEIIGKKELMVDKLSAPYMHVKGGLFTKREETMTDLYVAKCPVTNQFYREFISYLEAKESEFELIVSVDKYKESLFAMASDIEGFSEYLQREEDLAKLFSSSYDDDELFNRDEQPVVGVTSYAACAYCLWLSLLESDGLDSNLYRLPTDREWEYAASGKEGRRYPWGNTDPTPKMANYDRNERATTPVGRYHEGATPDGLYDMAGNVWEWVMSSYGKNTLFSFTFRGGSWDYDADGLRCSVRSDFLRPDYWLDYIGFRVVRSSPSS